MSRIDEALAQHKALWHSVARYSVYRSTWSPTKTHVTLETGLEYQAALDSAAARQKEIGGLTFSGTAFGVKLENQDEALAVVRNADVWANLSQ